MRCIIISKEADKKIKEINELMQNLTQAGYQTFIIPWENRRIGKAKELIQRNSDALLIIKEVDDNTYGEYLYSCAQIIKEKEEKTTVVFYDIFKEYINRINLIKVGEKLRKMDMDAIVITRHQDTCNTGTIYSVSTKGGTVIKMGSTSKHSYTFIGMAIFRNRFFKWIKNRYGVDPGIINRDLHEILNAYLFNGNKIDVLVV